ncbi:zinc-binding dehydrogenase [Amycolatopsis kentuckyensis]|uniref:zinc-binding dehydrogenase n=1 Tax=Amycolatopsis kentuckyensis TaxID=218823 RepID=UPI000A3CADDC|nr:zinc-binding dehydrogenase [Amycolatopsis kentuckyensis]
MAVRRFGDPGGLAVVDLPDPRPAAGQVVITPEAIGVGGVDVLIRRGALAAFGFEVGHVLGGEVAGVVTALGAGVDESWAGTRVWAPTDGGGGYAEQALAPAAALVPLPPEVSPVDAVTVAGSGVVAHFGLRHAHFAPGESVLVRGAAGGIGVLAVQLAARTGTVTVTTSSAERGARLRALGATHVLDRSGEGATGHDVVFDIVAGEELPAFFAELNPNGRVVTVGAVAGPPPARLVAEMFAAFRKSLSFAVFSADSVSTEDRRTVAAGLLAAVGRGELDAVVHEVLPLRQAADAHRQLDAGAVFGRIALVPA